MASCHGPMSFHATPSASSATDPLFFFSLLFSFSICKTYKKNRCARSFRLLFFLKKFFFCVPFSLFQGWLVFF